MADITIALAGNQNCGKTTVFNRLTGSNQHVGNFPGVTVEQKQERFVIFLLLYLLICQGFIRYLLIQVKKL